MTNEEYRNLRIEFDKDKDIIVPDEAVLRFNTPVEMYAPNGQFLGSTMNDEVLADWRLRIALRKAEGYYIVFEGEKIPISCIDGNLDYWPEGLLDLNVLIACNIIFLKNQI